MHSIYGIYRRSDAPLSTVLYERLAAVASHRGGAITPPTSGVETWLGPFPAVIATQMGQAIVVAAGRLDNREELGRHLVLPPAEEVGDDELIRRAYGHWGRGCVDHLYGDWLLAAWHPTEHRLLLCRGHYGNLPLYYFETGQLLAFTTSRHALLHSGLFSPLLDELWLAQYLLSWPAYHGERTAHGQIKCLPPGHFLTASPSGCTVERYWFPENGDETRFPDRDGYRERFRVLFDQAVRCRLEGDGRIAATLSGGLDSSAVTATAAGMMADSGQRLTAFTSVPCYDTRCYTGERFGDEYPFAQATAEFTGAVDLIPVEYGGTSPVAAIRQVLGLMELPCHGAGNLFWLQGMQRTVREAGFTALLTGGAGNAGVSWPGDLSSQPWRFLLANYFGGRLLPLVAALAVQRFKAALPTSLYATLRKRRLKRMEWYRGTAIQPDFASRLQLLERRLEDPDEQPARNPLEQRARILLLGRSVFGVYMSELGALNGLEIRDPTADARLLEFVLSVPDRIFMDPKTGIDRWLIRAAMQGRLPDEVRLNRRRGLQAADMVPRLRACAAEVECTLDELAHGPAAEYVDVEYMRQVWRTVQAEDTPAANVAAKQILLRGIMAGLFVNDFYE